MSDEQSLGSLPTQPRGNKPTKPGVNMMPGEDTIDESPTIPKPNDSHRRFKQGEVLLRRYRVEGELGQGGMGVVYRCYDETGGIEVALKALPPDLSHNSSEMEEVRENFQLVEKLHQRNIAAIKQLERDEGGNYYLVMECVAGLNLRQWRRAELKNLAQAAGARPAGQANLLDLKTVLPIARQIAVALDYAHEQRIIHRDIKPSNIMVAADGNVKVLDFGLAAQMHSSRSRISQVHFGTSGTGPYMAPEQWEGKYQDAATDQYALAATTYELLAGYAPFDGHEINILREAVLRTQPSRIPGLDDATWAALLRGLSKRREERFASCGEFVDALAGKKAAIPAPPLPPPRPPPPPPPQPSTRKGIPALAIAAVVLVAGGLAAYWLLSDQKTAAPGARQAGSVSSGSVATPATPTVTLAEVAPVRSAAELKWSRVQTLERNTIIGARMDGAEVMRGAAQILFDNKEYALALEKYRQFSAACDALLATADPRMALKTKRTTASSRYGSGAHEQPRVMETPPAVNAQTALIEDALRRQKTAAAAREKLVGLNREYGFGASLERAELLWQTAETARNAQQWAEASGGYEKYVAESQRLQDLDGQRQQALTAAHQASAAKQSAALAGAPELVMEQWTPIAEAMRSADKLLEQGLFADAERSYQTLARNLATLEQTARQHKAYRQAKSDYEAALAQANISRLNTYGGEAWAAAKLQAQLGASRSNDPAGGLTYYQQALAKLPTAIAAAEAGPNRTAVGITPMPVPAPVAGKRVCPTCQGAKTVENPSKQNCGPCGGHGMYSTQVGARRGAAVGKCTFCDGTGKAKSARVTCGTCGGAGFL
jgi:serine/threonine-protein kinase